MNAARNGRPQERSKAMAKGEQKGNREAKKPKKEKPKTTAAAAPMMSRGTTEPSKKK